MLLLQIQIPSINTPNYDMHPKSQQSPFAFSMIIIKWNL
jgi:hypothetical protein